MSVVRGEGGREEMGTWDSMEAGSGRGCPPHGRRRGPTRGRRDMYSFTCGPQGGGELRAGDGGRVVGDS